MRRSPQPAASRSRGIGLLRAPCVCLLAAALVPACASPAPDGVPAGFELHPAFELDLAAAEPIVVDPIDLAFDELGRAFVLELPGYPDMERPARIVGLSDSDGDGRWDTRRLFADDLGMADSILPWRRGLLVAAPPDILYLEDEDGDGDADRRDVLLSGFAAGNPQHNVNALRYGLDNWVYGVNGGNGARVFWPDAPEEQIELGQDDFRVDFGARRFERTGRGAGGFGMTFGPWGRAFGTHNLDHLSQLVIPRRYLGSLPAPLQNARLRLAPHPDGGPAELFPIGARQTRPNHPEQSGRFSAACSVTVYAGGAFAGTDLPEQGLIVFVADPSANVVHRAVLDSGGVAASARRGRPGVEFLASTDPLFRPVNLKVGPDGALYVVDMHRGVIEHPEWIPDQMEAGVDLYEGGDRGRIYRVAPAGGLPADALDPGPLDRSRSGDLIEALGRPNRWRRLTAQRLLVEEHGADPPDSVVGALREILAAPGRPLARLHALWTLAGLATLDGEAVEALLGDPHPELRRNAVLALEELLRGGAAAGEESPEAGQAGEGQADPGELAAVVVTLIADRDPGVRLQAMLTAGLLLESNGALGPEFRPAVAAAVVAAMALGEVEAASGPAAEAPARREERDRPWLRRAAVSVLAEDPVVSLELLLQSDEADDAGPAQLIEQMAALVPAERLSEVVGDRAVLETLAEAEAGDGTAGGTAGGALLAGLAAAVSGSGKAEIDHAGLLGPLGRLRRSSDVALAAAAWRLSAALSAQVSVGELAALDCAGIHAADSARPVEERLQALALFGLRRLWPQGSEDGAASCPGSGGTASVPAFPGGTWLERMGLLLEAGHPEQVQRAAMAVLAAAEDGAVTDYLIARWPYLGPVARRDAGAYLIRGRGRHSALLDALERGRIRLGEMNFILERRRFLLRSPDPEIRRRARALFDDAGVVSRPEALAAMQPALDLEGDRERGEALFLDLCARCHRSGGAGGGPGPDLSGIGRKSAETLLHDILDPNAAVDTGYVNYIVETVEGETFSGLLAESSGGGVVLRMAEDVVVELPAGRIREVRSDGLSMMPEELESGLEPADLADLLAFLRRSR